MKVKDLAQGIVNLLYAFAICFIAIGIIGLGWAFGLWNGAVPVGIAFLALASNCIQFAVHLRRKLYNKQSSLFEFLEEDFRESRES